MANFIDINLLFSDNKMQNKYIILKLTTFLTNINV